MRLCAIAALSAIAIAGCADCRAPGTIAERSDTSTPAAPDASSPTPGVTPVKRGPLPKGFVRGQLHTHSNESDDCQTPPVEVQRWYEAWGYDFVVFTDHNHVTDTPDSSLLTIPGAELTRNIRNCEPPPPFGVPCALHMSALFATPGDGGRIDPGDGANVDRLAVYKGELARARSLGALAMLNHPNMMSGADTQIATALAREGLVLLEVANQAWDAQNEGDATRHSTEAIWDEVLVQGLHMFATATDDAHHYADADALRGRGEKPFVGDLGFVVVHAAKNARAIRAAIEHGDFYASTGVVFETYERSATSITLSVREDAPVDFEVISHGGLARREHGTRIEVKLRADDGPYVRVRAKARGGAFALAQPLFRAPTK
jgi:hypothetical protein